MLLRLSVRDSWRGMGDGGWGEDEGGGNVDIENVYI